MGGEAYRSTLKTDGRYVTCMTDEQPVGDTIALVMELYSCAFVEAVERLIGQHKMVPKAILEGSMVMRICPQPALPQGNSGDRSKGREYLQGRGIDLPVIDAAETARFVRYIPSAVVFVGYDDQGKCRSATRRATDPSDPIQKRDFANSDKSYPPILPGTGSLWIVEGGVDALALHTLCARSGHPVPHVVVSGGINVRSYLDTPHIQKLVIGADLVTIACEHEKDEKTQNRTNRARGKLLTRIEEITGWAPSIWMPEVGVKDLGEIVVVRTKKSTSPALADADEASQPI